MCTTRNADSRLGFGLNSILTEGEASPDVAWIETAARPLYRAPAAPPVADHRPPPLRKRERERKKKENKRKEEKKRKEIKRQGRGKG